ncbi:acyltransferase [Hydrogenimonas sp.]
MNIIKKIRIYRKYRKLHFKYEGKSSDFHHLSSRFIKPENIFIGDYVKIGEDAYIDGNGHVTIDHCTIIGPKVTIITANHHFEGGDMLPFDNVMTTKRVIIGPYCWLGRGVTLLPGTTIGKCCVVAAGSVVHGKIEDFSIIGGNPAQLIRFRNKDEAEKLIKTKRCVNDPRINPNPKKIWQ